MEHIIDAKGKPCPQPVVMAMKTLEKAVSGDTVKVLVDNETAVSNLSRLANSKGCSFVSEKTGENEYLVRMCPGDKAPADSGQEIKCEPEKDERPKSGGPLVVSVGSDKMGEGNDELGRLLMKGFVYAVTQLEQMPETILFYNGGARLTVEGSQFLEDLKSLEEQGVEILTCGTCLDYYKLKDKLAVGKVTNMYTIVETLAGAGRVIKP